MPVFIFRYDQFIDMKPQRVSRHTVSELINEHRPLTPDIALRLSKLVGRSAGAWLKMQQAVDIWEVEHDVISVYAPSGIAVYLNPLPGVGK
jgi:hypothetical protein